MYAPASWWTSAVISQKNPPLRVKFCELIRRWKPLGGAVTYLFCTLCLEAGTSRAGDSRSSLAKFCGCASVRRAGNEDRARINVCSKVPCVFIMGQWGYGMKKSLRHGCVTSFFCFLQFGRGLSAVLRTGENGRGLSIFDGACLFIRFDFFAGFFLRLFRRTGAAFSEKFFHFRYYWYFVVAFA